MYMQGLHYDFNSLFQENPYFLEDENFSLNDYGYLVHLYPRELRLMMVAVKEYLDRYEYEGSPIFHEYPDSIRIYRMTREVYELMYADGESDDERRIMDILHLLICQEIYVRRRRHEYFCKYSGC